MSSKNLHQERRGWVEGVIATADAQPGPLSGEPTVYYELWAYGLLSGRCLESFRLERFELVAGVICTQVQAGEMRVEPDRLPCRRAWLNRHPHDERLRPVLERFELADQPWFEHRVLQLVEFRIAEGDTVRVWGQVTEAAAPSGEGASYRQPPQAPVVVARSIRHTPDGARGIPRWSPPP